MISSKHLKALQPIKPTRAPTAGTPPAYKRLEKPMEARGTNTIFMPPLRCSVLSSVWRSSAALRPPAASASLKREAITATIAATCAHASSAPTHPQHASRCLCANDPKHCSAYAPQDTLYIHVCSGGDRSDTTFDTGLLSLEADTPGIEHASMQAGAVSFSGYAWRQAAHLDFGDGVAGAGGAPGQEGGGQALRARAVLGRAGRVGAGPALGPHAVGLRPVPGRRVQGVQGHLQAHHPPLIGYPSTVVTRGLVWFPVAHTPAAARTRLLCAACAEHMHSWQGTKVASLPLDDMKQCPD